MATTKKTYNIAKDIKEQILKRVREEGIPVSQAAQEHGISDATISLGLPRERLGILLGQRLRS